MPARSRQQDHRSRQVPLWAALAVVLVLLLPSPVRTLAIRGEWMVYDGVMRLAPAAVPSGRVLPAVVTQRGIERLGQPWPWDRQIWSWLVQVCARYGAKALVFDVLFLDPHLDRSDSKHADLLFAALCADYGQVYCASFLDLAGPDPALPTVADNTRAALLAHLRERCALDISPEHFPLLPHARDWTLPLPALVVSTTTGFINVPRDDDGVTRRTYLVLPFGERLFPSLDLLVASAALDTPEITARPGQLLLKSSRGHVLRRVPVTPRGEMYVNFAPTAAWLDPQVTVDISDLLLSDVQISEGTTPVIDLARRLDGRIVLVGLALEGSTQDTGPVPNERELPFVFIHANAIDNLLQGQFRRPLVDPSGWGMRGWVIGVALVIGWLLSRLSYLAGGLLVLGAGLTATATQAACARWAPYVLPMFLPGVAALLTYTLVTSYSVFTEDRERRRIRAMWSRYSPPEVVEEVMSAPDKAGLYGVRRKITVMSVDVRGFTPLSERSSPEETVALLNRYFAVMADVVFRNQGTINNYIGDCMMVLFGAPVARPDDTLRAVRTALEIRQAVERLRDTLGRERAPGVGIGLNSGEAVVGNIGTERLLSYTAIGDTVNTAFRLEATAQAGQILLSAAVYAQVRDRVIVRALAPARLKGKSEPVEVYELLGMRDGDRLPAGDSTGP